VVNGLWKGLQDTWSGMLGNFQTLVNLLPASIKKILGIASPSTVFYDIGENIGLGVDGGILNSFKRVSQHLRTAMAGLSGGGLGMNINANINGGPGRLAPAAAPVYNVAFPIQTGPFSELDYRRMAKYVAVELRNR
jgi:hypothetical protein